MIRILVLGILVLPFAVGAQTVTTLYTDIDDVLYKKVVIKGRDTVVTYFDEAGQPILDICDPAIGSMRESLSDSICRAISNRWKRDTTQPQRALQFSFFLSSKGYSNVRLIGYDFGFHTPGELRSILLEVLDRFQPKTDTDCWSYFQWYPRQWVMYPIHAEKKSLGYVVEVQSKEELREVKREQGRQARKVRKEMSE